jgi:hypothetical protein
VETKYKLGDVVWMASAVSKSRECPTCKYDTIDNGHEARISKHTVIGILYGGCGMFNNGKAISEVTEYILSDSWGGVTSESLIYSTREEALKVANELALEHS